MSTVQEHGTTVDAAAEHEVQPPVKEHATVDVLVYSDDRTTRRAIIDSVGRRAGKGLPLLRWTEAATHAIVVEQVKSTRFALLILDGEAAKVGGMGISRQLKTSLYDCPPILVTIARPQDAWLATWSEADGYIAEPLDPVEMQEAIAGILRQQGLTA